MKLLKFAEEIAIQAGKLIKETAKGKLDITEKGKNDLVTNADKASEKLIIEAIKSNYPKHGIIAEETQNPETAEEVDHLLKNSKYIWIIDPLDGTTNFAHQIPLYCVSIGLLEMKSKENSKNYKYITGELVAGVVYAPELNEIYTAAKGKGAKLNGQKIQVSEQKDIGKSLSVTGFPPVHKESNLPYFEVMLKQTQAVRRLGSAALDLCYVAAGRFDSFWEFGLHPWDIAAGSLIVTEAGGHVSDTNGETLDLFGKDLLATNGHLHKKIVTSFKNV